MNPISQFDHGPGFRRGLSRAASLLAAATLLLIVAPAGAQTDPIFGEPALNVPGVPSSAAPVFVDIDNDGDLDAFVGDGPGDTNYFENTGTPGAGEFAPGVVNPFGLGNLGFNASPDFADLDGDSDFDALIGDGGGNTWFFENTGTPAAPAFAVAVGNPFGLAGVGSNAQPEFRDLNGDGDVDAYIGNGAGDTVFYENTGTAMVPVFVGPSANPFGLANVGPNAAPDFVDVDGDGDLDAFVGAGDGNTSYFENTAGPAATPVFSPAVVNALGLSDVGSSAVPTFGDIDNDGVQDAFVGAATGDTLIFLNQGTAMAAAFSATLAIDVGSWAVPTFGDIDDDGDLDAFVGASNSDLFFYENTGSSTNPAFAAPVTNPNGLATVPGGESAPDLFDYDDDGDLDIVSGSADGNSYLYRNIGSAASAAFAAVSTNPDGLVNAVGGSTPDFTDIDNDGDLDVFIGVSGGDIRYHQNTGTAAAPAYAASSTNPFGLANVGSWAAPEFVDLDDDGDLDALVGAGDGETHFFRNIGSVGAATFASPNVSPFGLIDVGGESSPAFPDIDNDGDVDAFIGASDGTTTFLENLVIDAGGFCGDGNLDPGEQCDDGNTVDGDGCSAACIIVPVGTCGDGTVTRPTEECDDSNTTPGDGCDDMCMHENCGDGVVDPLEECDDGNTIADDECDNSCFDVALPLQPIAGEIKSVKIGLKFNKPAKDKIDIKIKNWTLPMGLVPTDVTVDLGGTPFTGTLDAKGKFKSPDKRDSIQLKQSKKSGLWKLTVKRKKNDFAASLVDEGLTDADNPKPGLPVTVPMSITVGGQEYGQDMNLIYKSKLGKKGSAK